jgi:hypothetical protein
MFSVDELARYLLGQQGADAVLNIGDARHA